MGCRCKIERESREDATYAIGKRGSGCSPGRGIGATKQKLKGGVMISACHP